MPLLIKLKVDAIIEAVLEMRFTPPGRSPLPEIMLGRFMPIDRVLEENSLAREAG